jgi:hypothetical protein
MSVSYLFMDKSACLRPGFDPQEFCCFSTVPNGIGRAVEDAVGAVGVAQVFSLN